MSRIGRAAPARSRGAALFVLLAILALGTFSVLITGLSASSLRKDADGKTTTALARAKEALMARAVLDANRPGSLPCPDLNDDGSAELFSGDDCLGYVGRLPWRQLVIDDIRDGTGERLWYAMSNSLRDHPYAQPINLNTPANLELDGKGEIAAIIFAPGTPLDSQSARPSNSAAYYLEQGNADGDMQFQSSAEPLNFNDRALAISRAELFHLVAKRVLGELRSSLLDYYPVNGNTFPTSPSPGALPSSALTTMASWLTDNQWDLLVIYTVTADQQTFTLTLDGLKVSCTVAEGEPKCS